MEPAMMAKLSVVLLFLLGLSLITGCQSVGFRPATPSAPGVWGG